MALKKETYKIPFCVQRIVWIQLGDDKQAATLERFFPKIGAESVWSGELGA